MAIPKEYGREIDLPTAQDIIQEHINLDQYVAKAVDPNIPPEYLDNIKEFMGRDKNAFIFKKDLITRFFNKGADHLLVIVGAHLENEKDPDFPPGSFTVVTMGCTGEMVGEELELKTLPNEANPANEYPRKQVVPNFDKMKNRGSDDELIFTVK